MDANEQIEAGDVVAVVSGKITKPGNLGTGTAVARANMTLEKALGAIGRALENRENAETGKVLVAVGVK